MSQPRLAITSFSRVHLLNVAIVQWRCFASYTCREAGSIVRISAAMVSYMSTSVPQDHPTTKTSPAEGGRSPFFKVEAKGSMRYSCGETAVDAISLAHFNMCYGEVCSAMAHFQ